MRNNIPVFRKDTFKEYNIKKGIGVTIIIAIVLFFLFLINNSLRGAFWLSIAIWLLMLLIYGLIIMRDEYFGRRLMRKRLKTKKYKFLYENNFEVNENLFFEGIYNGYYFRIHLKERWVSKNKKIEYEVIESFYNLENRDIDIYKKEKNMSGEYYFGNIFFCDNRVSFIPKKWQMVDFEENFNGLINVLKLERLLPLSKEDYSIQFDQIK